MAQQAGTKLDVIPGGKNPDPDDNVKGLTEAEQREANLHRHLAAHREIDASIEVQMNILKGLKKQRSKVRAAAKNDQWLLGLIDEQLKEENTSRRDRDAREAQRSFIRMCCGMPTGTGQGDMVEDEKAIAARDEESWARDGYLTGLRGAKCEAPDGMPPEYLKRWTGEWHRGDEKLSWAMAEQGSNPERAPGSTTSGPTAKEIAGGADDDDETFD